MLRLSVLLFLLIGIACVSNKPKNLLDRVKAFDTEYGKAIQTLSDSLREEIRFKYGYTFVLPEKDRNGYYREVDSMRKLADVVKADYYPSLELTQPLRKAKITGVHYSSDSQIFFMHLDVFNLADSLFTLYLYYGEKKLSLKKTPFYTTGNRVYIIGKKGPPNEAY